MGEDHDLLDLLGANRISMTQPMLVSRYEARDQRALDQIRKTIEQHVAIARSSG